MDIARIYFTLVVYALYSYAFFNMENNNIVWSDYPVIKRSVHTASDGQKSVSGGRYVQLPCLYTSMPEAAYLIYICRYC